MEQLVRSVRKRRKKQRVRGGCFERNKNRRCGKEEVGFVLILIFTHTYTYANQQKAPQLGVSLLHTHPQSGCVVSDLFAPPRFGFSTTTTTRKRLSGTRSRHRYEQHSIHFRLRKGGHREWYTKAQQIVAFVKRTLSPPLCLFPLSRSSLSLFFCLLSMT